MIGTTVTLDIKQDIETTYDWVVDADTPAKIIHSQGPVPGFKTYKLLDGDWKHEGARRRVILADGSTMTESIKTIDRPKYFDYTLTDFKDSMLAKLLLKSAYGQWWFESREGGGTHVRWRYSFEPQNALVWPLLWLFTNVLYRGFMQSAMDRMKVLLDKP